jgi:hypothetical protein
VPTYEVTAPDGRTFELTGDKPPTEKDLDDIFAKMPAAKMPDFSDVKGGASQDTTQVGSRGLKPSEVGNTSAVSWGIGPGGVPMRITAPTQQQAIKDAKGALPAAGALGAMVASGGTAALPLMAAAALGGAGGKGVEHMVGAVADTDDTPTTAGGVLTDMGIEGAKQGAYAAVPGALQGGAKVIGRIPGASKIVGGALREAGAPLAKAAQELPVVGPSIRTAVEAVKLPKAVLGKVAHAFKRAAVESQSAAMAEKAAAGIALDEAAPQAAQALRAVPSAAPVAAKVPSAVAMQEAEKVSEQVVKWQAQGLSRPQMVQSIREAYGGAMTPTRAGQIVDDILKATTPKGKVLPDGARAMATNMGGKLPPKPPPPDADLETLLRLSLANGGG